MPTLSGFNGASLTPNIGRQIAQGVNVLGGIQELKGQQAEQAKQAQLQQLLGQAFPGQAQLGGGAPLPQGGGLSQQQAQQQLQAFFPKMSQDISAAQKATFDNQSDREKQRIGSVIQGAAEIQGLPVAQQISSLEQRKARLISQGLPTNDTDEQLNLLNTGRIDEANALTEQAVQLGQSLGVLKAGQSPTSLQQNIAATGLQPGTPEFQQALTTAINRPQTQVNIGGKAEGKEREEIAKVRARQFEQLSTDADNAEVTLASLDQIDAIGATTGALEPAKASVAAVFEGLGVDASGIANITTSQSLNAASNRLVNAVLNQAKGPQTEGDAQRAKSTIRNLGDDPLAGQFKSDSLRAISLRTIEQRDFVDAQIDAGETFSKARAKWNTFKKDTPSLSAVVKNPQTGLPVFFYQFKQSAQQKRPGITDQEIIEAWRGVHGGK